MSKHGLKRLIATLAPLLAAVSSPARADPFVIEGVIMEISALAGGEFLVRCGAVPTIVSATTIIQAPLRQLTLAQLADQTPFPYSGFNPVTGALKTGFIGAACIAEGDTLTRPNSYLVDTLAVEVTENVLVGVVTSSAPFMINGVLVVPTEDKRLVAHRPASGFYSATGVHPAGPEAAWPNEYTDQILNDEGFGVAILTEVSINDSLSLPLNNVNRPASAVGYFGVDGKLHAHEIVAPSPLKRIEPRPAITRNQCRVRGRLRDELEIRGSCVLPPGATTANVTLDYYTTPTSAPLRAGITACTLTPPLVPTTGYGLGVYRFRSTTMNFNGLCPQRYRASMAAPGGVVRYDFVNP